MCGAASQGWGGHASSGHGCAELGAMGSSTKVLTKTEPRASGLGLGQLGDVGKQLQVLVPGSTAQGRCQDESHEKQRVRDSVFQEKSGA